MTIDERLQALVQTVELLASMHRDEESRRQDGEAERQALAQSVDLLGAMHKNNEARVAQLMDTMTRLGRIVEKHDLDIDDHELRINDIEGPNT